MRSALRTERIARVLVAQPEERRPPKPQAAGSTPAEDADSHVVVEHVADGITNAAPKAQAAELPPGTREMAGASPARGSRANAVFLVTDPEEVEGPGRDPGARRFESARSHQSACRLMVKAPV